MGAKRGVRPGDTGKPLLPKTEATQEIGWEQADAEALARQERLYKIVRLPHHGSPPGKLPKAEPVDVPGDLTAAQRNEALAAQRRLEQRRTGIQPSLLLPRRQKIELAERELTRAEQKRLDKAVEIRSNPDDVVLGWLSPQLVLCTLPHSDPGNVPVWSRTNRNLTLSIQAKYDEKEKLFLHPYGPMPRLLLVWLITEAVQKRERVIPLGSVFNELMLRIGLNPAQGGGKFSDRARFLEQVYRLSRAIISFDDNLAERSGWKDLQVAPEGLIWWKRHSAQDEALFPNQIELGEKFFEMVLNNPVPLDLRITLALKRSSMAIDLYHWLTYCAYVYGSEHVLKLPWKMLREQLGAGYARMVDFRKAVNDALVLVRPLYPAIKVKTDEKLITVIKGSRPSVSFTQYRKRERAHGIDGERVVEANKLKLKKSTDE